MSHGIYIANKYFTHGHDVAYLVGVADILGLESPGNANYVGYL